MGSMLMDRMAKFVTRHTLPCYGLQSRDMAEIMKMKMEENGRGMAVTLRGKFDVDSGGGLRKLVKTLQDGINISDAENGSIIKGDNIQAFKLAMEGAKGKQERGVSKF